MSKSNGRRAMGETAAGNILDQGHLGMRAIELTWIGCAYLLGLLFIKIPGDILGIPAGAIVLLLGGAIASFLVPRIWRTSPKSWVWLIAGVIGLLGVLYFHLRLPAPAANDICHLIRSNHSSLCTPQANAQIPVYGQIFEVEGTIATAPRLTRNDRYRFELEAHQVKSTLEDKILIASQAIAGTLYVTVPKQQAEALYPQQRVKIQGSLYQPKPASSPGGFDFQAYLRQAGIFTGLIGKTLELAGEQPDPPLLWSIQRRIIQAQEAKLGKTEGHLVSAMVMGKSAVDVPYPLQDEFKQAGLAHALAASGAQVSLLIGIILALTQRLSARIRFAIGIAVIVGYVGLTGIEPSVLRAGVMGSFALLGLTLERRVKPLGALLLAAVILLLWNPLWIYDLGFQLSFLATLGLLVTVPVLSQWLDWMPTAIAPLFAVPIAAYLWTIPLQLFTFGIVSPYSILVNIGVSPLITIISIGGMISALGALIWMPLGSFLAGLLHYPTWLFIKVAELGNQLPGSQYAVGTLTLVQLLMLYGLIVLIWRWQRSQAHWWVGLLVGIGLVMMPAAYSATHLLQITLLGTATHPVIVIQNQGDVIVINSGNKTEAQFTVLPFLQKQGINRIDWAIAPQLRADEVAGWQTILEHVPIRMFYNNPIVPPPLSAGADQQNHDGAIAFSQTYRSLLEQIKAQQGNFLPLTRQQIQLGSLAFQLLIADGSMLQLHIQDQDWLFLNALRTANARQEQSNWPVSAAQVLWWGGKELNTKILEQINPQVAIAPRLALADSSATKTWFTQHRVALYAMEQTGSIQWTPQQEFTTTIDLGASL